MQLALRRASWMTSAQTQVNPGRAQRRSPEGRKQPFEASGSARRQSDPRSWSNPRTR